jgi:[ribosomal protein S5]-alanine N-acetyltransferase
MTRAHDEQADTEARGTVFDDGLVGLTRRGRVGEIIIRPGVTISDPATVRNAVGEALETGFGEHDLASIIWATSAGDLEGWRVMWAHGFTFTGTLRGSFVFDGEPVDSWHASLLAGDVREPKTTWLEPVMIERDDLVLRDVKDADQSRFLEALDDPASQLWLGNIPLPRTPAAFRDAMRVRLLNASLGRSVNWTVADPETDAYLASVTVFGMDSLDYKSGEVGYRTHPDARGRGVITSALRAVIAHAFTPLDQVGLGLERIQLLAGDGNDASLGVARSCGFTPVGRDRQCYDLADGRVVDLIRFDLLRHEFESA